MGGTGQEYNQRKKRKGAYWEDRYHATAVESNEHLAQCSVYIDLNMVRAGVVAHPSEWSFCGYNEIQKPKERYALIDYNGLKETFGFKGIDDFVASYRGWIDEALKKAVHHCDPKWTESIAVGSESFVNMTKELLSADGIGRKVRSTEEDRINLQKQLEDKNNQIDEALEALLGRVDFQAFEYYKDRIQDRQVVQELSGVLSFSDTLTGDQNMSLLESLYNKRKGTYSQLGYDEEEPSGYFDMNDYGISNYMEVEFIVYDGYIEGVEEAGLSESQEKLLKEYLEERQAVLKSILEREAQVASGEIDPEEADAEERVIILN